MSLRRILASRHVRSTRGIPYARLEIPDQCSTSRPPVIYNLRTPLAITATYGTFAGLWIATSDLVLAALFQDAHAVVRASTYKGIVFVALTSLLLYGLLARREREQRRAGDALAASEARFRATFEQAAVGIAHVALDGRWLRINEKLCEFLGYPRSELLAMTFQDVTHPADLATDLARVRQLLEGGMTTFSMDKRYLTCSGQVVWAHLTVSLVRRPDGQPDYFISVVQDISARKQTEAALIQSEANYHELFAANPQPMWVYDVETLQFLDVNDAAVAHYGYTRDEFLAMTIRDIRPAEELPRLDRFVAEGRRGVGNQGIWRHRTRDGRALDVEIHSNDLRFQGKRAKMVLASDVTARIAAEHALQDAMSRLRVLSARLIDVQEAERRNVARELHDEIGQGLTAIKIVLQTVQQRHPDIGDALAEVIVTANGALEQVRELSRGLWPSQLDDLGLAAALRSMAARLQHTGRTKITVDTPDTLPALPPSAAATCYRVAQEALTNVIRHANAQQVAIRLMTDSRQLCLEVADDGQGFAATDTLATAGQNSLGLLGMQERASLAGGALTVDSQPGSGTRVTLCLPLVAA